MMMFGCLFDEIKIYIDYAEHKMSSLRFKVGTLIHEPE